MYAILSTVTEAFWIQKAATKQVTWYGDHVLDEDYPHN